MKSRLIAVALMTGLLLAGAASAQKTVERRFQLQDDETNSLFTFHSDGSYQYVGCGNGIGIDGVGIVKISGCTVTFEADNRFRLIQAEVDLCRLTGRASILLDGPSPQGEDGKPMHLTVIDTVMADNPTECG